MDDEKQRGREKEKGKDKVRERSHSPRQKEASKKRKEDEGQSFFETKQGELGMACGFAFGLLAAKKKKLPAVENIEDGGPKGIIQYMQVLNQHNEDRKKNLTDEIGKYRKKKDALKEEKDKDKKTEKLEKINRELKERETELSRIRKFTKDNLTTLGSKTHEFMGGLGYDFVELKPRNGRRSISPERAGGVLDETGMPLLLGVGVGDKGRLGNHALAITSYGKSGPEKYGYFILNDPAAPTTKESFFEKIPELGAKIKLSPGKEYITHSIMAAVKKKKIKEGKDLFPPGYRFEKKEDKKSKKK